LAHALKDAYAVFAVTSWGEIMNKEREIQQGENIADAAKVRTNQKLEVWQLSKFDRSKMFSISSGAAFPTFQRV
jgi:hypothetical protein